LTRVHAANDFVERLLKMRNRLYWVLS